MQFDMQGAKIEKKVKNGHDQNQIEHSTYLDDQMNFLGPNEE